jgi:hypothetical protein
LPGHAAAVRAGRFRGTTKGMHARGEVSERTPMRVRPDARSMSSPSAHTAMRARSRARTQSRRAPHWPSQSGTLMAEDDRSLAACAFPPDTALNTRLWTGPRPAPIHGNRQIYSSARVGRSLVALHRSFTHQVYPALITTCTVILVILDTTNLCLNGVDQLIALFISKRT